MIAYQVGWLKHLLCITPVWWEKEHFSSHQWKSKSGLWLWGAEGGLYFPEKSHYYCPANLWLASRENLPAERLSFLLPSYALLISLWPHHPLWRLTITQPKTHKEDVYATALFPSSALCLLFQDFSLVQQKLRPQPFCPLFPTPAANTPLQSRISPSNQVHLCVWCFFFPFAEMW